MRWLLATGAAGGAVGTAAVLPRKANAYYSGPVTDHFDGERFFNPGGSPQKGLGALAKLYFNETWEAWPATLASPFSDEPPARVTQGARLSFIGHASWLIQAGGVNLLVDPHWSERASPLSFMGPRRANAPGIAFDRLPSIDAVLVTHNHYDHMDTPTLARLWSSDRPRIVTPLGNDQILRSEIPGLNAEAVDWGARIDLTDDVRIHVEPAQHWSARGIRDRSHALWASFMIETPAGKIYAAGDSGLGTGRIFSGVAARHPVIRAALLPIGAYGPQWFMKGQHMNPHEAVEVFKILGAERALGQHWGTFRLTTEPHDEPPQVLAEALAGAAIPPERFIPVRPGQVIEI